MGTWKVGSVRGMTTPEGLGKNNIQILFSLPVRIREGLLRVVQKRGLFYIGLWVCIYILF